MIVGQQKAIDLYQFLAKRKDSQDVLVWLKPDDGNFTIKSAWDYIRSRGPSLTWAKWIWHNNFRKKISIMM